MNFVCHSGEIISKNDNQHHYLGAYHTANCFYNAIMNLHCDSLEYRNYDNNNKGKSSNENTIHLYPREDGNYSMVDEIFEQYIPTEKWASVAITGKDGKPFYIKDDWLKFQIIMRCEKSVIGLGGNNTLLNKLILEESKYPKYDKNIYKDYSEYSKKLDEWDKWWGAKQHILDTEIFDVELFSSSYAYGPRSFINPKNGKIGLVTNCRWTYEPIAECRDELEWICNEICDEENNLEFYVSFFDEDINFGKYKKEYKDPQVTFKLSHKGIELVPVIPVKKMKWVFKCNQRLYGKEWRKVNFLWEIKKLFRKIQKKLFYEKYVIWHNYTLMGDCLNNIMDLSERYYTVDEIIKMIQIWKELGCDKEK